MPLYFNEIILLFGRPWGYHTLPVGGVCNNSPSRSIFPERSQKLDKLPAKVLRPLPWRGNIFSFIFLPIKGSSPLLTVCFKGSQP